jgi:glycosyltransferase involved in cell wall biosynthesis
VHPSLRIALLVDPLVKRAPGGAHAEHLARELLGLGHTIRPFGDPAGLVPRSGDDPATEGHPAPPAPGGLAAFAPDAIVAYGALSPAAFLGARGARRLGVPLILVETGFPSGTRALERLLRRLGESLWGRVVRRTADRLLAIDRLGRDQAIKAGFPAKQVGLLAPGVDTGTFRPGLASGLLARHRIRGRTLLYVGTIERRRGLELLIGAFARTVGQRGDWNLVVAGEGPDRGHLRTVAERNGVSSRVYWLGWPREEELPGLMSASTLLALPVLEPGVRGSHIPRALAAGLPVLTTALPRLAEWVEHDVSGLVVPAGDLGAWVDAIRRAAASPLARRRWGESARRLAEERLAWPRVAQAFESLLLECGARAAEQGTRASPAPDAARAQGV